MIGIAVGWQIYPVNMTPNNASGLLPNKLSLILFCILLISNLLNNVYMNQNILTIIINAPYDDILANIDKSLKFIVINTKMLIKIILYTTFYDNKSVSNTFNGLLILINKLRNDNIVWFIMIA